MWCTTECWNCEDKNCKHYFSKQDIYFKYKKLQSNWNSLRELLENEKKLIEKDKFFCTLSNKDYIEFILDKMNELKGKDKNDK